MEVGKLAFQLHVIVRCAGDIARAARAGARGVQRLVHGCQYHRVLAHAEIVVGAPHRNVTQAVCREMVCHWKGPAATLQIREHAVSTFPMKALKPLLEQALKVCVGLLHVFPIYSAEARVAPLLVNSAATGACPAAATNIGGGSFSLQTELSRRSLNLARCRCVVLEDLKRVAEGCCRDLSLAKHDSRAHQASPAIDISRRAL